jgi:aryl-alcohol dehydrogenase-like predicted oxidoreductase
MVEPPWRGCQSAGDAESRRWLKKTQTPLLAWSSQARGFFTDRAAPDRLDDAELVRCWYSDDNWKRRERTVALAQEKGVSLIALAGAYVFHQPFPTLALIGPRTIAETRSSLEALRVELTPRELAWLNLERAQR